MIRVYIYIYICIYVYIANVFSSFSESFGLFLSPSLSFVSSSLSGLSASLDVFPRPEVVASETGTMPAPKGSHCLYT